MSFNIGLSGLYAASKQLDVTGNNIANVATTGLKASRAEFEDGYCASKLGVGSKTVGNGVRLAAVSQQVGQGEPPLSIRRCAFGGATGLRSQAHSHVGQRLAGPEFCDDSLDRGWLGFSIRILSKKNRRPQ